MKTLIIFVDETGEFGFENGASRLYGISFVFHEQDNAITKEINDLNKRLIKIGYTNMIHMTDLIMKRNDYQYFTLEKRKSIFNAIYEFSKRIPVKYHSIFIDKKYASNSRILRTKIVNEINNMIKNNENNFNKFDKNIM